MIHSAHANYQYKPNWDQAMKEPFKDYYWKASKLEFDTLVGVAALIKWTKNLR